MQISSYLNLNFDDVAFLKRVDLAAEAGVDGIEFFGWDIELESATNTKETVDEEFYGPDVHVPDIAGRLENHGLDLVYMSGDQPAMTDPTLRDASLENIEKSVDLARTFDCPNVNVKAGPRQPTLDERTQRDAVVETLQRAAPIAEERNVTLLLEPLNTQDAPDHFLNTARESIDVIEAVDSPNVQLLFDVYHEQIMCGDVIRTLRDSIEVIGHIHIADVPTRNEPGTGELHYPNILRALDEEGYEGYVGCEFIPAGDPIAALSDVVEVATRIRSA